MSDWEDLIDEYGEANVKRALYLQDQIREEGIEGIHFMRYAEKKMSGAANLIVYQSVRSEMKKALRRI